MKRILTVLLAAVLFCLPRVAGAAEQFVSFSKGLKPGLVRLDPNEWPGVKLAAQNLASDYAKVCGKELPVLESGFGKIKKTDICIGTLGHSGIEKLLTPAQIAALDGAREKYLLIASKDRIVIAGSDKRGTTYGIYTLCEQMGVSPWYWWADVPVQHQDKVCIIPGEYTDGEPTVEYRGIFLNDEAPCLTGWVNENYGGYNSQFYVKVFELLLRLKGNFLWPAMWDAAFYDDDPLNSYYADMMGIVMGTSHHEPCARAQKEWHRYGTGPWDYSKNKDVLDGFWRAGIERMSKTEDIVTIGMRGDGDEPMTEGENIELLQNIIAEQRSIISQVTGKPASATPQVWALYKEVQSYYDKGMTVPDDVTLMICDDNWGNVRWFPTEQRQGGYGIYYHFDYVGGPRNVKWINTNDMHKVHDQMQKCYNSGIRKIWLVNVGDLKPMEYPIQFFLDLAWNPDREVMEHTTEFARKTFHAYEDEIAYIMDTYGLYAHIRTPEMLKAETYNVQQWSSIVQLWRNLRERALAVKEKLPKEYHDAYDQLVLYEVDAFCNLHEMRMAEFNNDQEGVNKYFARDLELRDYYNKVIAGGKWNHMMDQNHISYTYWQQPEKDEVPVAKEHRMVFDGR